MRETACKARQKLMGEKCARKQDWRERGDGRDRTWEDRTNQRNALLTVQFIWRHSNQQQKAFPCIRMHANCKIKSVLISCLDYVIFVQHKNWNNQDNDDDAEIGFLKNQMGSESKNWANCSTNYTVRKIACISSKLRTWLPVNCVWYRFDLDMCSLPSNAHCNATVLFAFYSSEMRASAPNWFWAAIRLRKRISRDIVSMIEVEIEKTEEGEMGDKGLQSTQLHSI